MKIKLKNLQPNPFRDAENYPLIESKIKGLEETIQEVGFWGGIPVRKNGTGYQIHFGHHRVQALKNLFGLEKAFDFVVENVDDETMHKRMVAENDEEWGATTKQIDENVRSTKIFLTEHLEIAAKYTENPEHWLNTTLVRCRQNGSIEKEIGTRILTRYLQSAVKNSWSEKKVRQSLARLKMINEDGLNQEALELIESSHASHLFGKLCIKYGLDYNQQLEAAQQIIEENNFGEKQMVSVIQSILNPPNEDDENKKDEEDEVDVFNLDEYLKTIRGHAFQLRKDLLNMVSMINDEGIELFATSYEFELLIKELGRLFRKIETINQKELTQ